MATDLGKAYIQIVPSAKGITSSIKDVIEKPMSENGVHGGSLLGGGVVKTLTKVLATGTLGTIVGKSLTEGGKLQQSIGGVETLFGSSADKLKRYASRAFRDTGTSANVYMEQATSFASALVRSCGGNTAEAVEIANTALKDMSDNSNKFGTDMGLIQNAYQGFAKNNYTMLDNLKLGYGGTKQEMERLLSDAQKLTGVHYDINNLSDVFNAIHAIQENLKVTNTTQKEASTTLSGSFNMMKASWSDFLGSLSTGQNVTQTFKNLMSSLGTFVGGNLIPMLGNIVKSAITIVTDGMNNMPQILDAVQKFASNIAKQAPHFIKSGFEMLNKLADGIISALPVMISKIPTIVSTFANVINDNAPTILMSGAKLIGELAMGIIQSIPVLIANVPKIIMAIVDVWSAFNWLQLGSNAVKGLGNGIKSMFGAIKSTGQGLLNAVKGGLSNLPSSLMNLGRSAVYSLSGTIGGLGHLGHSAMLKIASAIESAIRTLPSKMLGIGKDIVKGIWNGISNMGGWIAHQIGGFASGIVNKFKKSLGIHSPSRVMRDMVGVFIGQGIGTGIIASLSSVKKDIDEFNSEVVDGFNPLKSAPVGLGAIQRVKTQMDNEDITNLKRGSYGQNGGNNGNVYQTLNVNSPQQLDPSEVARQTRNANRELILKLKGV
jgi:phage-related protein